MEEYNHRSDGDSNAQFYLAFNSRDLKMMDDNFAHSDEVAIDNPLGGIRRGADEPHKMYEGVFKSPADVHVEFWDYTIHRAGDVFWAVGRERGTYNDGEIVKNLNVRTTRIFQLIGGRWRQMHHHGSIEDAALLGEYQNAIRILESAKVSITTSLPKLVERLELIPRHAAAAAGSGQPSSFAATSQSDG